MFIVKFEDFSFVFDNKEIKKINNFNKCAGDECLSFKKLLQILKEHNIRIEVIGNIHQNPELVK